MCPLKVDFSMPESGQTVTQVNANKMTKIKIKVGNNYSQNT